MSSYDPSERPISHPSVVDGGISSSPGAPEALPDVPDQGGAQDREPETAPQGPTRAEFETLCTALDVITTCPTIDQHLHYGLSLEGRQAMVRYAAMRMGLS